ncbi:MAG TPA: glycosyltransferase family protein [Kofleriaceae bacterium]|jgi:spore coat polysaccharide biosynthesis protein SpsF
MRTVAIVQARMGSTRLPGKVLRPLGGDTVLGQCIRRLRQAASIQQVVIATTTNSEDNIIVDACKQMGVQVHRGSPDDVLDRYVGAARASYADAVVRVTSDCPLIDGGVVDRVVGLLDGAHDYVSNTHDVQTFPRGLDVEAFHRDTLERMGRMATSKAAREHVTVFVREQPALFRTAQLIDDTNNQDLRWTVDTDADLELVTQMYERFGLATKTVDYRDLVRAVRAEPSLTQINAHIPQKDWRSHAS